MARPHSLDATFSAFADPTRRAMLARLARGDATVAELNRPFGISQPAISKHLKVLEAAGLVAARRSGPSRPRRLNAAALAEAIGWIASIDRLWRDSFDRLDALLLSDAPKTGGS